MQSNLLLNKNNTIYHLGLSSDQIASTIITVGDPSRVSLISNYFDTIECKISSREFITHTGYIANQRISVVSTGIGTDNIDIVLNEIDALYNVDWETACIKDHLTPLTFIRIGTSGSIRSEIPVDSFVLCKAAIGLDSLMQYYERIIHPIEFEISHYFEKNITRIPAMYFAPANDQLLQHFSNSEFIQGVCVTAPGFYGPQGRYMRARPKYLNLIEGLSGCEIPGLGAITNLEMETAGIYSLSELLGHRSISINAILANRISNKFSSHPEKTIIQLIENTLPLIISIANSLKN